MAVRLKAKYQEEIKPQLKEEFGISNDLSVPKLEKVVVNVGMGEAKDNRDVLDKAVENLTALAGQKPVITRAKKSISNFKLSKGQAVGARVTLRGNRMYEFLDKLVSLVLPKVRDFRGVSTDSFDNQGNFTLGLREQVIFPEVSFQGGAVSGKIRGLEISVITTAKNKEQGKRLLELLGMPFKK
ncbi:MAG: 50S ribosomal protein L5 [Candidatus Daviesbacteria bacterium GW2011_GWA1_41_61]|uniref:Large ribosomal subunit protein uL5 n=1 Tax=Candidatus Daviesbacteria bacterium GW2011_GWA2_40_9 TaxID=1618424 RepID=A0A0G0TYW1_9BACT|nr:MAG: 50S ribosomal protein L5 [Candidatus Daviesbacteria bacterium GW2011_GWC1_40_9]KKR82079.1 MAG: 50S ribosomal protein L5 [Candidatus Daviesbacteria bacterium GW2011_GWA2_40_9]KKR93262.1 MAG: 50S ribosomal protein L5 [Candidatus Daviesbacteria bacterium GW2011_GWB1_41_15]KKS14750.1 MAG: 50S ribosomal protein L5 [Candidatus Daviesbacteria bacterium GW2011_GWA1_41_61]